MTGFSHNDVEMAVPEGERVIERRACWRVKVLADYGGIILVDVPSFKTTGRLINIGENGLAVHFACPVADSATMEVDFSLGDQRLTDTCEVIWSTPASRGLRFLSLGAEQRREIRLWMERRTCRRVNVVADYGGIILVDLPAFETIGRLINIGENGLAVHFACPVADSATMEVDFSLGDQRLTDTCAVIWSTPTSRGLRFLSLGAEQRREIRLWMDALPPTNGLPSTPQVKRTSDGAAAEHAQQPAIHQQNARCEEGGVAEWDVPDAHTLTTPTAAVDSSADARKTNEADEVDAQHLKDLRLITGDPNAATVPPRVASSAAALSGAPSRIRPDWACRIVARQQVERLERLNSWRMEHKAASDVPGEFARSARMAAGSITPATLTIGTDHNVREEALTDAAVAPGSSARNEIRELGLPHDHKRRSGVGWLVVLAVSVVAFAIYGYMFPNDVTLQAHSSGSETLSSSSVAARVVEIVEGKPILHGHVGAKASSPRITPGTAVLRDMPAYDNSVLVPGAQADVHAVLTISDRGIVESVQIISGAASLAKEVTAATSHWRYTPYLLDSNPVTVDLPITLKFRFPRGVRHGKARTSKLGGSHIPRQNALDTAWARQYCVCAYELRARSSVAARVL